MTQRARPRRCCVVAAAAAPPPGSSTPPPSNVGRRDTLRLLGGGGAVAPLVICCCGACGGGGGAGPAHAAADARGRAAWYDRYFAAAMHSSMGVYEDAVRPLKERLFGELAAAAGSGAAPGLRVLEVGIGTGPNLAYLARAVGGGSDGGSSNGSSSDGGSSNGSSSSSSLAGLHVTGLDPNPEMQPYARAAAAAAGLSEAQLELVRGDAQRMPFADASFGAAVITLVLCSVPDPRAALAEIRRVVAPGGRLLLIEHVGAPFAQRPLLSLAQHALEPLQRAVADGCSLTRRTRGALEAAGFDLTGLEEFDVPGIGILAPHIAGVLRV